MKLLSILILVLGSILIPSCSSNENEVIERSGNPDIINVSDTSLVDKGMEEAREHIQVFLEAFRKQEPKNSYFALKKGFEYGESGDREFIWLNEIIETD